LLTDEATGGPDARAVALAATIELIHLATLVHDDSVDHSVLRRGMPTINSLFSHQISVIMGDYLYSRAVIELVNLSDLDALRVLSRVTNEMTVGEMRQLLAHDRLQFTEEQYDLLIRAKTASLLSGAAEVGALAASAAERSAVARFGEYLGMAFQIVDDLLDFTELATVTGKPSGNDLREHKVTLPLIHALPQMNDVQRTRVQRLMETEFRSESFEIAQTLKAHAVKTGRTPTQFALAWLWANRIVTSVIAGPRTLEQWTDYVAAIGTAWTETDEKLVDSLVAPGHPSTPGFSDPQYPFYGRRLS